ncbi:unnamed protein product [Schistosoma curassoni]|uniref:Zf-CRD domain-containing protein n=1 Tax=Schistosoma curassoni TaxID=6186 RepID=A0A183KBF7_9TREM|nr:unnamed protein product [Schistosoma curassoni]
MAGKYGKPVRPVKNKEGKLITATFDCDLAQMLFHILCMFEINDSYRRGGDWCSELNRLGSAHCYCTCCNRPMPSRTTTISQLHNINRTECEVCRRTFCSLINPYGCSTCDGYCLSRVQGTSKWQVLNRTKFKFTWTAIDQSHVGICASCADCLDIALRHKLFKQRWIVASSGIQYSGSRGENQLCDADLTRYNSIPRNLLLNNRIETRILDDYLTSQGISIPTFINHCLTFYINTTSIYSSCILNRNSLICKNCSERLLSQLAYQYRLSICPNELPTDVIIKPNCYYGQYCRYQSYNYNHARRFNHICERSI